MTQLLTRSGAPLSRLTFGTMQFGGKADLEQSKLMYEAALEESINHFDTAVGYNGGASEKILGTFIKQDRDDLFIATKVGYVGGASKSNILKHFENCKKQLNEDAVDLLYMHRFDDQTPLEETFETLAELQASKQIRYIGVSNYAAWQIMKAQDVAKSIGTKIDVVQPMYSLVKRQVEVEIMPVCVDQDIKLVPYSPLGGGLLTGKYATGGTGRLTEDQRYKARYDQSWMHEAAAELSLLAANLQTNPATLAVAWVVAHKSNPSPIISARSVLQLLPSLEAENYPMDDALYNQIAELSMTPAPATDRLEEG